jgi:predicted phosphodiesterase
MLRIGVFGDMHGNRVGLDAVLADMAGRSLDRVLCLGDIAQGGAQPHETIERLRALDCPVALGNADAFLRPGGDVEAIENARENISDALLEVRSWSMSRLSDDDRRFLDRLVLTEETALDGGRAMLCFHGSPRSFDDVILPETPQEEFAAMMGEDRPLVLAGGHTHLQQMRRLDRSLFFNPGSAGFAYDRHLTPESFGPDSWAEYAILEVEEGHVAIEFRRVPYDVIAVVRAIRASGHPYAESTAVRVLRGAGLVDKGDGESTAR